MEIRAAPTLTGEATRSGRLNLRPRSPSDADALFSTMSNPDMMRWWSRAPFDCLEDLRKYFAHDDQSSWRSWAIVLADALADEKPALGFVSAGKKRDGVVEIGYLLAQDAQGQGYAREAVALLIDHLFAEGHRRVFADTDPDNQPSVALLTALGFTLEGHLRAEWQTHIGIRDSLIYGLLAEEWSSRTAPRSALSGAR